MTRKGGAPVSRSVLDTAIDWRLRLDAGEADSAALDTWLASDAEHARVWRQLNELDSRIAGIGSRGRAALLRTGRSRRASGALVLLLGIAALLPLVDRQWPLRHMAADHVTATGEQRSIELDDGTRILLDARSAIDIAFGQERRRIVLRSGQLLIETGQGDARPLVVTTEQGELRPLGTRFTVLRRDGRRTRLAVLEAAVEVTAHSGEHRVLQAGEGVWLTAGAMAATAPLEPDAAAWVQGMLAVEDAPLADIVATLSSHTTAHLSVDPNAAQLRVTGTFPLDDIDLALAALTSVLPLRERRTTDWWIRLERVDE